MKQIIVTIDMETGKMEIETKGYRGLKCIEESQFLKDALGEEVEQELKPIAYETEEKEHYRCFKPLCG